jgi:hypothetical protein
VRVVGILLLLAGMPGAGYALWASFDAGRTRAVLFALAAPVLLLIGILGAVLMFVPGFLG